MLTKKQRKGYLVNQLMKGRIKSEKFVMEIEKIDKKCLNCGKTITEKNYKKHYPIIAGMFCKE